MKSNKRRQVDLSNFLKFPDAIISKFDTEDAVNTKKGLRVFMKDLEKEYTLRKNAQNNLKYLTVQDIRKLCNVMVILNDIAYVSEDLELPNFLTYLQLKIIVDSYSTDRDEINSFLEKGTFVIDIVNPTFDLLVFMDWENEIIACLDKQTYRKRIYRSSVNDIKNLDVNCDISDNIYFTLFSSDTEDIEDVEDKTKFDEEYFELDEKFGFY